MPSLKMRSSYPLDAETIDRLITMNSPGVFALGHMDERRGVFIVERTGRGEGDVRSELHRWIGQYPHFKFVFTFSGREAYERECEIYHDFGESTVLDNSLHPMPPMGRGWTCPQCDQKTPRH